jgi:hypothetical protein
MPAPDLVQFRPGKPLAELLATRATRDPGRSPGVVAKRDLLRYYLLLEIGLDGLGLTEAEACLICDALNGTWLEDPTIRLSWAEVADACRLDHLDEKWAVDGDALVAKLRALSLLQQYALADAVERFWQTPELPTDEGLRRVGLLPTLEAPAGGGGGQDD